MPDPTDAPRFAAYLEAMQRHGAHPVQIETTVADLMVIVSTLQLALRHPAFPVRVRAEIDAFLAAVYVAVEHHAPILGEVGRLGDAPAHDVPAREEQHDG